MEVWINRQRLPVGWMNGKKRNRNRWMEGWMNRQMDVWEVVGGGVNAYIMDSRWMD